MMLMIRGNPAMDHLWKCRNTHSHFYDTETGDMHWPAGSLGLNTDITNLIMDGYLVIGHGLPLKYDS